MAKVTYEVPFHVKEIVILEDKEIVAIESIEIKEDMYGKIRILYQVGTKNGTLLVSPDKLAKSLKS